MIWWGGFSDVFALTKKEEEHFLQVIKDKKKNTTFFGQKTNMNE